MRDRCFSQEEFNMGWAEAPEVIDDDYLEGKFYVESLSERWNRQTKIE